MTLPKLESPKYEVVIPSTKKLYEIRPFLVKEEKILMIAQESNNTAQIVKAMKEIISACSFDKIKVNELTSYDVEYLFLQLRAISVGETADVKFKCSECGHENEVTINLKEVDVKYPEKEVSNKIQLSDTIGIMLKPLSLSDMSKIKENADIVETITLVIESIYDEDSVYNSKDSSKKELYEFVESLNHTQIEKIQEYLTNQPKLSYEVKFVCSECGHENTITLEGIQSFFT
jgi:transcription elongation factor Elf1